MEADLNGWSITTKGRRGLGDTFHKPPEGLQDFMVASQRPTECIDFRPYPF